MWDHDEELLTEFSSTLLGDWPYQRQPSPYCRQMSTFPRPKPILYKKTLWSWKNHLLKSKQQVSWAITMTELNHLAQSAITKINKERNKKPRAKTGN